MTDADKKTLQQTLRETWMSALGVLSTAEGGVARMTDRVLEACGLKAQGEPTAEGGEAGGIAADIIRRVRKNEEALERRVDEAVKAAVARVKTPLLDELASLRRRVEQLQKRVEQRSGAAVVDPPKAEGGDPDAGGG